MCPKKESKSDDLPLPKGKHGRFSCPLLLPPSVGHPSWSNGHRTLLVDGNSNITSSFSLSFPQKAKKILPFPQNFNLPPGGKTSTENAPSLVRMLSPTVYLIAMVIHHQSHPPHKSMRICVPPFFLPLLCFAWAFLCTPPLEMFEPDLENYQKDMPGRSVCAPNAHAQRILTTWFWQRGLGLLWEGLNLSKRLFSVRKVNINTKLLK